MDQQGFNFSDISLSNTKDSQNRKVLELLKAGRRLTALDSLNEIDCLRLGARCWDLRHGKYDGVEYPIKTEMIKVKSGKRVAQYVMENEEHNSGGVASESL